MAKYFADTLYFECIAEKASKTPLYSLKVEKNKKRKSEKMDGVNFETSEQSIRKMVKIEVARSFKAKVDTKAKGKENFSAAEAFPKGFVCQ